jgi:hypothetical protein
MPGSIQVEAGLLSGVLAAERDAAGNVTSFWLDSGGLRLTTLAWQRESELVASTLALSQPVDLHLSAASIAGEHILVSSHAGIRTIDRRTGKVDDLLATEQPAVLAPNGKAVIAASEHGPVDLSVIRFDGRPPRLAGMRPLAVFEIDSPRALTLVPTADAEKFALLVAGYGALTQVDVDWRMPYLPRTTVSSLSTGRLPYDPLHFQLPAPLLNQLGAHVFVTDEGRVGLIAVDLRSGADEDCPLDDRGYGAISHVVPRLDGAACLVRARDGGFWRWEPGWTFARVELPGFPLLWDDQRLLAVSEGAIGEVALS